MTPKEMANFIRNPWCSVDTEAILRRLRCLVEEFDQTYVTAPTDDARLDAQIQEREQRIALEKLEQQPWDRIADVPLDAWFRSNSRATYSSGHRVSSFYPDRLDLGGGVHTLSEAFTVLEWSLTPKDETSWRGCNKRYNAERCL